MKCRFKNNKLILNNINNKLSNFSNSSKLSKKILN